VVDDDQFVRKMLARTLESAGFHVLTATDGQAALHLLRSTQESVDLVVSDVEMPVMGGRAMAAEMASAYPEVPILFISGSLSSWPVSNGEPYAFLAKPFTHAALLSAVQRMLGGRSADSPTNKSRASSAR
jgi:CheY-like chemotaxis protein